MNLKLKHDPIGFILKEGDETARLHLLAFLGLLDTEEAKELILSLLKSQMPNGGFPSRFDRRITGVMRTCRTALLLLRCKIPVGSLNIQSAVNFLIRFQRDDGGWSETPKLTIPKKVVELSNEESVTWLTADVIELLRETGLEEGEECHRALSWLRRVQSEDGGWFMFEGDGFEGSDPDSTAQITFLMKNMYGEEDSVYLRGKKLFERFLDGVARDVERGFYVASNGEKREKDVYHLIHLLLSSLVDNRRRIDAGYDLSDGRVKKIINAIIESQLEDGGWRPFWTARSDPVYTVLALKLLVLMNVLEVKELRARLLSKFGRYDCQ